jgi:lipopolysaccharide transport system ATP-binding protein
VSVPAIQVRSLGKQYRLGERESYRALRDVIAAGASRATRAVLRPAARRRGDHREAEHVWALRQVEFDVHPGEILGVIGHNGAGKSTLLRVLARITHPTEGEVTYRGRVGSLLEVGTGFHPELTGGENVYLSGAILGMSRHEIRERFDEIVAFAEIEPFIDTPVKRFSTGMYMRLAFAVAAHLDTEILLVDEVLAVGDARFQQKCFGALEHAAFERGRTVLFVSHNMGAIERLCGRSLLLQQGRLVLDGKPQQAVERYLEDLSYSTNPDDWIDLTQRKRSGSGEARFRALRYSAPNGAGQRPAPGRPLAIDVVIESSGHWTANHLELAITDRRGTRLIFADVSHTGD